MKSANFFLQLAIITLILALVLFGLHQFSSLSTYATFSWLSLAFFVLLSVVTYYIGNRTVLQKNKFAFINAALGLTFIKMLLCVVLVGLYIKLANPPARLFILPFLGIYVVYTIFETYFMMKIGKTK